MIICLGPVCVPLHLLLPFLLGLAHQYGWLTFIRREWLTLTWWRATTRRWLGYPPEAPAAAPAGAAAAAGAAGNDGGGRMRVECDGDVCRLVPEDEGAGGAAAAAAAGSSGSGNSGVAAAAAAAAGSSGDGAGPRRRRHQVA